MRDDYLDRSWADHHHKLGIGFDKLFTAFMVSMERLTVQQFDAPWREKSKRDRHPAR
ncbi:MAG: hypothetical protein ABIS14_02970 [Sphingomonas sp.]